MYMYIYIQVYRATEFSKGYGNKGKGSREWEFYGLVATQGPTMVRHEEKFLILEA